MTAWVLRAGGGIQNTSYGRSGFCFAAGFIGMATLYGGMNTKDFGTLGGLALS